MSLRRRIGPALKSPLARRLIVAVILFSATITLVMTAIQLYEEYLNDLAGIDAQFEQIRDVNLVPIARATWATNTDAVQIHLDGLIKIPNMVYATVRDNRLIEIVAGKRDSPNTLERSYEIAYDFLGKPQVIGKLTVVATLDDIYADLLRQAIVILLSNALRTFLVALFILALFHRLIARHMATIADHLRQMNPAVEAAPLLLDRQQPEAPDELEILVGATNEMQTRTFAALAAQRDSEARTRLLLDSTAEAIFGVDVQGICTFANPACVRMLGYAGENELIGRDMHALAHHSHADGRPYPKEECTVRKASLAGQAGHSDAEVHWRADGSSFPVEFWSHPMYRDSNWIGTVVTFIDISERLQAARQELRFRAALDSSVDAIYLIDRDTMRFVDANRAAWEAVGYSRDELFRLGPQDLMPAKEEEGLAQAFDRILAGAASHGIIHTVQRRKDGSDFAVEISIKRVLDPTPGSHRILVALARDVTERKNAEAELHRLAYFDSLTALPNRMLFSDRLRQSVANAERSGQLCALMLLDIDRFKDINDTMGHSAGDRLLQEFAHRLRSSVRDGDTVARLGGDEFALLFQNVTDTPAVAQVAQHLLDQFARPMDIDGRDVFVGTSIGIALYPSDTENIDSLLKFADSAMYHAKDAGRGNYQFYSAEMTASAHARLALETELRQALERNELFLEYQPQVETASGRITGMEALLRWRNPAGEMVPPTSFIPVAEETGLINQIGAWVLDQACRQWQVWQQAGHGDIAIAVNVATRQFRDSQFVVTVRDIMARYGVPPGILELEITEGVLLNDSDQIHRLLQGLKQAGVCLAIDDFGTGYSSLSYLRRFPIDRVKIDQSFVRDIGTDKDDLAIVQAIIGLARTMRLEVVAEGVETQLHHQLLQAEACGSCQGYYFARPMDAAAATRLLLDQAHLPKALAA